MAPKQTKAPQASDDIDDLFSGIGGDANDKSKKPAPVKPSKTPAKPTSAADKDILADLESELTAAPSSRPHTPRAGKRAIATPPAADDKPTAAAAAVSARKSTDSAHSLRASFTPSATSSELHESEKKGPVEQQQTPSASEETPPSVSRPAPSSGGGGSGWWGVLSSTANAAMKQAEAAYNEIQKNEEAKKWTEQVKGLSHLDVSTLRTYGENLRNQALPTFTNILHTLAPPISSHERLLIHTTHDLVGYPSLDPLIHATFSRVMSQVEGGDLLVVQRGQESSSRRSHDSTSGWRDGPWWRHMETSRELGLIKGLTEGTKLCRASADSYAQEYFAAHGGLDEAKSRATESVSESNPVRTSDIFLAVQAIATDADKTLFARTASAEQDKTSSSVQEHEDADEMVCFAVFLLDPVHEIEYSAVSQAIPAKWAHWLDASGPLTPRSGEDDEGHVEEKAGGALPDDIRDIIESGGVDPREWVAEWMEEVLSLNVGIVAQRYVAKRMGVGEGGVVKGKRKVEDLVHDNADEAARIGLI